MKDTENKKKDHNKTKKEQHSKPNIPKRTI